MTLTRCAKKARQIRLSRDRQLFLPETRQIQTTKMNLTVTLALSDQRGIGIRFTWTRCHFLREFKEDPGERQQFLVSEHNNLLEIEGYCRNAFSHVIHLKNTSYKRIIMLIHTQYFNVYLFTLRKRLKCPFVMLIFLVIYIKELCSLLMFT